MKQFVVLVLIFIYSAAISANGFIVNVGQFKNQFGENNNEVLFIGKIGNLQIQLRKNGYSYEYINAGKLPLPNKNFENYFENASNQVVVTRIDVDFLNANKSFKVITGDRLSLNNYYLNGGNEIAQEVSSVTYQSIYPNIDIEFLMNVQDQNFFKYNIILHPGADITQLQFLVKGADADLQGETMILKQSTFSVSEKIPACYLLENKKPISNYKFQVTNNLIRFFGAEKITEDLVIDPVSNLMWGTYQGGSSTDINMATASDAQNNIYVTGYTSSTANLATNGAFQVTLAGSLDIFLAKFSSQGQRIWTTYYGSNAVDLAYVMCVKPDGTSFLGGATNSTVNLATAGAHQTTYGGGINDIVIAAFDANGQRIWASYYGGAAHDITQGITYDKVGNVLFTGHTESTNNIATLGAYKTVYNFNYDVCLVKFTPNGQRVWGTYYGDSGVDEAYAICTDNQANIYITGLTASITDIATAGAHQQFNAGAADAFIAKIDSAGKNLLFGTFYGGTMNDAGTAIECDGSKIYVGGNTSSTNNIASAGAQQTTPGSADDAFLASFSLSGARLWCTYIGGEDTDYLNDIILDSKSQIHICGATASSLNISTTSAWQSSLASIGNYDAYLARYSSFGIKQLATYYGGEGNDQARGITLDDLMHVYIAGETTSTLGIATNGAFQTNNAGNTDAFLAKFCIPFSPKISPANSVTICPGTTTLSAVQGYSTYLWSNAATTSSITVSHTAIGTYTYFVQVSNGASCSGTSEPTLVKVVSCLGIASTDIDDRIIIYPNPAETNITIKQSDPAGMFDQIRIIDCTGKVLYQQKFEDSISIAHLPKGVYCLQLFTANKISSTTFVKQ